MSSLDGLSEVDLLIFSIFLLSLHLLDLPSPRERVFLDRLDE